MIMKYYSTNNKNKIYSFKEAFVKGLADDNGLFVPEHIPQLSSEFFSKIETLSLTQIAIEVLTPFISEDLTKEEIKRICEATFTFEIPVINVEDNIYSFELFHGPTAAFKDVGARFLANCYSVLGDKNKKSLLLVATSGDTGSAVANAFLGIRNVDVVILYPNNKVSPMQEKQFASLGENISAFAVEGMFDDCQQLVKQAFLDEELKKIFQLSSANSINIARWLPQSVYYFYAYAQLKKQLKATLKPIVISVPTGNLGNLTAGLLAKKMGLPIRYFISATNDNNTIPVYLTTGVFTPKTSVQTISNAMDVGNPSNYSRMLYLYGGDPDAIRKDVKGTYFDDETTKKALIKTYKDLNYLMDPHGTVGYLALKHLSTEEDTGLFLETAHPAKFSEVVEPLINKPVALPESLKKFESRTVTSQPIANDFAKFKKKLIADYEVSVKKNVMQ
jgi:threonine synthase